MPFKTKEEKAAYDKKRLKEILEERGGRYFKLREQKKEAGIKNYNKRKDLGLTAYCTLARTKRPDYYMFHDARRRAKASGLDFNIEFNDIHTPETCPILGIPLFRTNGGHTDNSPSLDRIDNSKGYVKDNVAVISYKANRYKSDMTLDIIEKLWCYMLTAP